MEVNPLAGKLAKPEMLINISSLITAYYEGVPDFSIPGQRIVFGTSGHRGSPLKCSFNERHIWAIVQAICFYRNEQKIDGPLYLGFDTHVLSESAFATAMEVLAGNCVEVIISRGNEYTPTPVISHAILKYNHGRKDGFADGIIITPSHNPPDNGGIKYNPPNGGAAGINVTDPIEKKANEILQGNFRRLKKISFNKAMHASTTHYHDYLNPYVNDLENIIDMDIISNSGISMGVDPLGGAGVHYWEPIAERYKLDLTVVNRIVDPTFSFMPLDWDEQIRMDPSSPYAMRNLIEIKDRFDISFACDTDHDRHGITTKSKGLLSPNHFLSVAVFYLLQYRPEWSRSASVGTTVVTSQLIDRITKKLGNKLYEVPVGFKWFSDGLFSSTLCFGGEESAGATFCRFDGSVWTTDKDGFVPALLSAEITAKLGRDPGVLYSELTQEFGNPVYERIDRKANREQREKLKRISSKQIKESSLAGEGIKNIITHAPGNAASINGIKVMTENGWFAARPSGTENIYKIYAESFLGKEHLKQIIEEGQSIVNSVLEIKDTAI